MITPVLIWAADCRRSSFSKVYSIRIPSQSVELS